MSFPAMRRIATGLLVLMAAVYFTARTYEGLHPVVGFVRAFAEAAMIGALADWFAVTALFRRPLGLPIPHTAIIPNSKARIGEGLAAFLSQNFLAPNLVQERLERLNPAGSLGQWLAEPPRAGLIAASLTDSVPKMLDLLDDGRIAHALREMAQSRLEQLDLAHVLADGIELLVQDDRHQQMLEPVIRQLNRLLMEQEPELRRKIKARTGWFWRTIGADEKAADGLITALRDELVEMDANPHHPARRRFSAVLRDFARDLRSDSLLRADVERFKLSLLSNPTLAMYLDDLWSGLKSSLRLAARTPDGPMTGQIEAGLLKLAESLKDDDILQGQVNVQIRKWAVQLAESRGHALVQVVAETIQGWDAQTVVDRIEQYVGKDLQYIRINGTLVGGLVGLLLHAISSKLF